MKKQIAKAVDQYVLFPLSFGVFCTAATLLIVSTVSYRILRQLLTNDEDLPR